MAYFKEVVANDRLNVLLRAANQRLISFVDSGILDSESARYVAYTILEGADGPLILRRLAHRFAEVIVDEFQDCDENEHAIVDLLAGAGINTVVVADPDQAIYEFRGADASLFAR